MASDGSVGNTNGYGFNRQPSFNDLVSNLMNAYRNQGQNGLTTALPNRVEPKVPQITPGQQYQNNGLTTALPRRQEPQVPQTITPEQQYQGRGLTAAMPRPQQPAIDTGGYQPRLNPTEFGGGNPAPNLQQPQPLLGGYQPRPQPTEFGGGNPATPTPYHGSNIDPLQQPWDAYQKKYSEYEKLNPKTKWDVKEKGRRATNEEIQELDRENTAWDQRRIASIGNAPSSPKSDYINPGWDRETGGGNPVPNLQQQVQPKIPLTIAPTANQGGYQPRPEPTDFGGGNAAFPTKSMNSFGQTVKPFSMGNNINRPKVGGK